MTRRLNLAVGDEAAFEEIALSRRPFGMAATRPSYHLLRETYFDTLDGALSERRMTLGVRLEASGRQVAELVVIFPTNVWEYDVLDYFPFNTPEAKAMAEEAKRSIAQTQGR